MRVEGLGLSVSEGNPRFGQRRNHELVDLVVDDDPVLVGVAGDEGLADVEVWALGECS